MAIIDGHIRCSRCRELKTLSEYAPSTVKNGCGNCRVCQQRFSRSYERANPQKVKAQRRAKYHANIVESRDKVRRKQEARRAANPEMVRAEQRRWYASRSDEQRAKDAEYQKRYHAQNKDRARDVGLEYRYGTTPAEYDRLLSSQGGGCACCGATANRNGRRLHVDHDHATGVVRGILCHHCNAGLGHFADDTDRMRKAIAYLERAPRPTRIAPMRINLLQGAKS